MSEHQTCPEPSRKALPNLWLFSDERNDAGLEQALRRLPRGSGFVFRHYRLAPDERRARFDALAGIASEGGHAMVLAGDCDTARSWGADGAYASASALGPCEGLLRLASVHNTREIAQADQAGVDAMFLSPVFPTRSHPGAECLGRDGFLALAATARVPVIALGGMTAERAAELGWPRWAAIDGLS
jgi:thiamine-phosphate pyrophosphorylase